MSKKNNIPKGVQQEFDDVDYWHKLPKNRFVTMPDGTKLSYYHYMKKFMHEYYGNNFDRKDDTKNILQTDDQKKEARRNNNNTNRDALLVSRKMGALNALFQIEKGAYEKTEEPWEKTFKTGTYNEALTDAVQQSCDELKIEFTKRNVRIIMRIYFRIAKFIRAVKKDQRNKK